MIGYCGKKEVKDLCFPLLPFASVMCFHDKKSAIASARKRLCELLTVVDFTAKNSGDILNNQVCVSNGRFCLSCPLFPS